MAAGLCLALLVACSPPPTEDTVGVPPPVEVPSAEPDPGRLVQGLTAANEGLRAEIEALERALEVARSGSSDPAAPPGGSPAEVARIRGRLADAERELEALRRDRETGSAVETELRAEVADLEADRQALETQLAQRKIATATAERQSEDELAGQLQSLRDTSANERRELEQRIEELLVAGLERSRELETALTNETRLAKSLAAASDRVERLESELETAAATQESALVTAEQAQQEALAAAARLQDEALTTAQSELLAGIERTRQEFEGRLQNAVAEADNLRELLDTAEADRRSLSAQLAAGTQTLDATTAREQTLTVELTRAQEQLEKLAGREREVDRLESERAELAEQVGLLEQAGIDLLGDLEESRRRVASLESDTTTQRALDDLQGQLRELEVNRGELEERAAGLERERDTLAKELEGVEASRRKALYDLEKQTQQSAEILASLTEANTRIEGLVAERTERDASWRAERQGFAAGLEAELSARAELEAQLGTDRTERARQAAVLESSVAELTEERDRLRTEVAHLRENLDQSTAERQAARDQLADRTKELAALRDEQRETVAARDRLRESLTASGRELTSARESLAKLRADLDETGARATELEKENVSARTKSERLETELGGARERLAELEKSTASERTDLVAALTAAEGESRAKEEKLTSLERELEHARASAESVKRGLDTRYTELEEKAARLEAVGIDLLGQIEDRDRSIARLRQSAEMTEEELRSEILAAEQALAAANEGRAALSTSLETARQSGASTRQTLNVAEKRIAELEAEIGQRAKQIDSLTAQSARAAEAASERVATLEASLDQTQQELGDERAGRQAAERERDTSADTIRARTAKIADLEERFASAQQREAAARVEIESLTSELQIRGRDLEARTGELAAKSREVERESSANTALGERVERLQASLETATEKNRTLLAESQTLERELAGLQRDKAALERRADGLVETSAGLEARISALESSLAESRASLEDAREKDREIARLQQIARDLESQLLTTQRDVETARNEIARARPAAVTPEATTTPQAKPEPELAPTSDSESRSQGKPITITRIARTDEPAAPDPAERGLIAEIDQLVPPAPKPGAAPPATASRPVPEATASAVRAAVLSWVEAWSAQNVDAYLASYARDFRPADGSTRSAWAATRRQRLKAPEFIRVRMTNLRFVEGDRRSATVVFDQSYRSNTFEDAVTKQVRLVFDGGRWRIRSEDVLRPQ